MRKFAIVSVIMVVVIGVLSSIPVEAAEQSILTITQNAGYDVTADDVPEASLVADAETGQILWSENPDRLLDPASTTKAMVAYLVFEAIKAGEINLDTKVIASETDQAISEIYSLSNSPIKSGAEYTVSELLYMTMIASANAATIMLSRTVESDDQAFLALMNTKAQELGMQHTIFYNNTGATISVFQGLYLPNAEHAEDENQSTARDLAILAYHLLQDYPQVLTYSSPATYTIKSGSSEETVLNTHNLSLVGAELALAGTDGLKTGSSDTVGYNTIVTTQRDGRRTITVILGASQWGAENGERIRHYFANALTDYAFSRYHKEKLQAAGDFERDGKTYSVIEDLYAWVTQDNDSPAITVTSDHLQAQTEYGYLLRDMGVPVQEKIITKDRSAWQKRIDWFLVWTWELLGGAMLTLVVIVGLLRLRK